jgi:hypothetical protein
MQKKRAAIILAIILGGFVLYVWNDMEKTRAYAMRIICWTIAKDLVTHTNSGRVALLDSWSATNFSAFLAGTAEIETVKLGDKPSRLISFGDYATARLCFTNQSKKHFEIRIRQVQSPTNFTVIGTSWD